MDRPNNKPKRKTWIFLLLICASAIFMSIGYAAIDSINFGVTGKASAKHQEGIFITDVEYSEDTNADVSSSRIVNFYQTILNSSIALSETDAESSITYNITVYNRNNLSLRFVDVAYDREFYDNENIIFELSGIKKGDKIISKESLSFSITFKYIDGVNVNEENFNNVLNSFLNFNFERDAEPVLANNMIPVYYESGNWKKTDLSSGNWHDYYNGKWANALTYNHNLAYNQVENDKELKVFNGTSDYINLGSANLELGTNITLAARFKISERGTDTRIIIGNVQSGGFYLGLTSKDKLRIRFYETSTTYHDVVCQDVLELNTWYTTVATYDGSKIKLYINGDLKGNTEYTGNILKSAAPIVIGGNPNIEGVVTGSWFSGLISETIVMREALTETEIAENYGETFNHIPNKHKVLYYLRFNGDNGIICNGASYEEEGMVFDGVDDYISVGYSSYDFNNTFSIGARVKLNAYSNKEYTIFGNPQEAGFNLFKSTDNKLEIAVYDQNTSTYINQETSFTPELNTWYTLMATYDGTTLKLYVDGTLHTSIDTNINMKVCTTPFMIGVNANLTSTVKDPINGMISDVILVDEALTANQISTYYSSDLRTVVSDKTLISYDLREYETRQNGTIIPDEMISTMWVWIPRFSATTPTKKGEIDTEIVGINDLAHDAFTFGGEEIEGFWIGKFENSTNFVSENSDNTVYIKPNNDSWTNSSIGSVFNTINNISSLPEKYGLDINGTQSLDTHLIRNSEWGAVAYFTHGLCGISRNGTYTEVEKNNTSYLTGGNNYKSNVGQSTTGNVYGVYDMAGGANEFVMGNYNSTSNSYFETLPNPRYYDQYTTQEDYLDNRLQHALFEVEDVFGTTTSEFVDSTNIWLLRDNLFSYTNSTGASDSGVGSRSILIVK